MIGYYGMLTLTNTECLDSLWPTIAAGTFSASKEMKIADLYPKHHIVSARVSVWKKNKKTKALIL